MTTAGIDVDKEEITIQHGFWWGKPGFNLSGGKDGELNETPVKVQYCVFMNRPEWWDVKSWYKVLKMLYYMPAVDLGVRYPYDS